MHGFPRRRAICLAIVFLAACGSALWSQTGGENVQPATAYPPGSIAARLAVPVGYSRVPAAPGSFADYLRRLPLKPGLPPVLLFDGRKKSRQDVHAAVVDLEIGNRDLQQCADAIIRLRAQWLWASGLYDKIHFRFASGFEASYTRWRDGWRTLVTGNRVREERLASPSAAAACFRSYLDNVFTYANTWSLAGEMEAVPDIRHLQIGDVFIQGGFPGHAVIVADMAAAPSGRCVFLLLQSYMPAQEIHVLKNPDDGSAWYPLDFGATLVTPEWTFRAAHLRRFK